MCLSRLTDGKGADIVFEMVGHNTPTVSTAAELCCPGGVVMCFGIPDVPVYDDFKFLTFFRFGLPATLLLITCLRNLDHRFLPGKTSR